MNDSQPTTSSISSRSQAFEGKLLALDVGLARIGIAVCDPLQLASRPLTILKRASRNEDYEKLAKLVTTEEAQAVVCGLPMNMTGDESDQTRMVRKWAHRLAHALRTLLGRPIPIILIDERLSTYEAKELGSRRELAEGDDAVAAAVILQRYLDSDTSNEEYNEIIQLPAKSNATSST